MVFITSESVLKSEVFHQHYMNDGGGTEGRHVREIGVFNLPTNHARNLNCMHWYVY